MAVPDPAPMGLVALLAAVLGGGGVWTYFGARAKARTDAPAQFAEALTAAAKVLIEGYEQRCKDLEASLKSVVDRLEQVEEENRTCQNENAQLNQRIDSLQELLRRAGVDIPQGKPPGAFLVLEGEAAHALAPIPLPKQGG